MKQCTVLLIGPKLAKQDEAISVLRKNDFNVCTASSFSEGLTAAVDHSPEVILWEVNEDLEEEINQLGEKCNDPIDPDLIACTPEEEEVDELLQSGVLTDAVSQPEQPDRIVSTLMKARRFHRLRQENRKLEAELEQYRDTVSVDDPSPLGPAYLFRFLMDNISDAIYFKDRDSRFLYISDGLAKKFGLDNPEEARGKTDFDFFSTEHARRAYEDEQNIIETGDVIEGKEEKETWHGGETTWVSTKKAPLIGPDGNILGTFGISRDITRRKKAEQQVQRHVEEMEKELDRARTVQNQLLPSNPPSIDGLKLEYRYLPYERVSGDMFSYFPFSSDRLGLFMGDVAGHGVSAALFMVLIKFITDRLSQQHGSDPEGFLNTLNEDLIKLEGHPSRFVTGFYGLFHTPDDKKGCEATLARGGHPDPILVRGDSGKVEYLSVPYVAALGIKEAISAASCEVHLEPGDRLLVYTDGLSEARSPDGDFIDDHVLLDLVRETREDDLGESMDRFIESVKSHAGIEAFDDDVVLCGLEITKEAN